MEKEKLDKMYDICFFDLDGTIIDSSPGITNSVMYALEKFGIEETELGKIIINSSVRRLPFVRQILWLT